MAFSFSNDTLLKDVLAGGLAAVVGRMGLPPAHWEVQIVTIANFLDWFTGGTAHPYHTLYHCMSRDTLWVAATVSLDLIVGLGYGLIALHWWRNARNLPDIPARKTALEHAQYFHFLLHLWIHFHPDQDVLARVAAVRLFLLVLVYFTWRYAWGAKDLKVVYKELGKSVRLSAELAESREQSRRKTAFLNALSHDLRTPLNGIALHSEIARMSADAGNTDAYMQAMEQINASAKSAYELLENMLECARLDWQQEPIQLDRFPVSEALRSAMSLAQAHATRKGLYLQTTDCQHLQVQTDRSKLQRILENLVNNAVKFTDQGGVRIAVEPSGDSLELHVIDTGVGLSIEEQGQVFDEFYQAGNYERDRQKGFGLGLAIARRLARRLGGDITLDSSPQCGSRFTPLLPNVVVPSAQPAEPIPAVTAAVG